MQVINPHKKHSTRFERLRKQVRADALKAPYLEKIAVWEKMAGEKMSNELRQEICGFSRATYFRTKKVIKNLEKDIAPPKRGPKKLNKPKWGQTEINLVLKIRRENSTYGKLKIAVILKRDHAQTMSESTVGRILTHLKIKGLIQKSLSAVRCTKKRRFKGHATKWCYKDYNAMEIGERLQVDHMSVTKNGIHFKHFQGWERSSKHISIGLYANAKSTSAKQFLLEMVKEAPYPIKSVQVDGGSEFMAEFEDACKELGIILFVLPPKRPTYNGGVERGNRTFREEFYNRTDLLADSLSAMRLEMKKHLKKYNEYRPHGALKGLTPMQYINGNLSEVLQSHNT